jgi:hypothetical protein
VALGHSTSREFRTALTPVKKEYLRFLMGAGAAATGPRVGAETGAGAAGGR